MAENDSYCLVGNEGDVRMFFEFHLSDFELEAHLAHLLILIARKKYCETLSKAGNLPTTILHAYKGEDRFCSAIRRYEIKSASKTFLDSAGNPIPSSALGVYVSVNPLDERKAYLQLQNAMNQKIFELVSTTTASSSVPFDVQKTYQSVLHKSAVSRFVKYDIDTKEEEKIGKLKALLREEKIEPHFVAETRGGYHLVLCNKTSFPEKQSEARRRLAEFVSQEKEWISKEDSGALVAVPGTYQGGFLVRFVDWVEEEKEEEENEELNAAEAEMLLQVRFSRLDV